MDWVERPWIVESPGQLEEMWQAALRQSKIVLPVNATCLCVPPWTRARRRKGEERRWVLADAGNGLLVCEGKPNGTILTHLISYNAPILVEEGQALLLGWIRLLTSDIGASGIYVEFHSSAIEKFRYFLNKVLHAWGVSVGSERADDPWPEAVDPGRNLYRELLRSRLGLCEPVQALGYQPRITRLRGFLRKCERTVVPQQLAVRTPLRWILLSDTDEVRNLEYGTRLISLDRRQWEVRAVDGDHVNWIQTLKRDPEKIEMFFPKRAAAVASCQTSREDIAEAQ